MTRPSGWIQTVNKTRFRTTSRPLNLIVVDSDVKSRKNKTERDQLDKTLFLSFLEAATSEDESLTCYSFSPSHIFSKTSCSIFWAEFSKNIPFFRKPNLLRNLSYSKVGYFMSHADFPDVSPSCDAVKNNSSNRFTCYSLKLFKGFCPSRSCVVTPGHQELSTGQVEVDCMLIVNCNNIVC